MQNTHNHKLKNGSSDTELAFEAEIVEELIKGISSKMKLLYGWVILQTVHQT
jgi:hypothetical protein